MDGGVIMRMLVEVSGFYSDSHERSLWPDLRSCLAGLGGLLQQWPEMISKTYASGWALYIH